ncbi:uncharacterized protein LOC135939939 [Cloeon dipterum]|uniref:uncharacterized protein LOC135939939 n=1 Tax=Cloeon dipterum TaxID=197152 RepID=UPI0032205C22
MAPRICSTATASSTPDVTTAAEDETAKWLEMPAVAGFKIWQLITGTTAAIAAIVFVLCCCVRFRIPRTKEEIEADYVRKKIARKFRRHLRLIQNSDMDEMDLKRALDRVRAEFKSDSESVAHSETALSIGSAGSAARSATYRKASDLLAGMTVDDLPTQRTLSHRLADLVDAALVTLRMRKRSGMPRDDTNLTETVIA